VARSEGSLLRRVALGSALSAMFAALVAAIVTSLFAAYLTRHANDQRLLDAGLILESELEDASDVRGQLVKIVASEQHETKHTGVVFGVFDGHTRALLAGDSRVPSLIRDTCIHSKKLRACSVKGPADLWIVAAAVRVDLTFLFAASSAIAALLAGLGGWLASRPIARWLMGPLSALRERVDATDFSSPHATSLGPPPGVAEVDALQHAVDALLGRTRAALQRAERFAADAAHELRTPLTTIRGELELLAEEAELPVSAHANVERARRRVIELQTVLERLLVLALPDESRLPGTEIISFQELAEDLIEQFPEADRSRVSLAEARGNVVVQGDAALISLVFSNSLGNALKFGRHVSVAAFEDGTDVVLRVDDDGPGIPVEQRQLVFEPFVRLVSAGARRVAGHGLGLALIAHVARRHGGTARFLDGSPGAHLEIRLPHAPHREPPSSGRRAPAPDFPPGA
jgi:two-component system OmpR family sensor kinase